MDDKEKLENKETEESTEAAEKQITALDDEKLEQVSGGCGAGEYILVFCK